jgi:hypothetical protein
MIINNYANSHAIALLVHPSLMNELKIRKQFMEKETDRKTKGGLTAYSEMAASELRLIRLSGDKIIKEILKLQNLPIKKITEFGVEREYVPYEIYKKLYIYLSILDKKKDCQQFKVELSKVKGQNKNEIKYLY